MVGMVVTTSLNIDQYVICTNDMHEQCGRDACPHDRHETTLIAGGVHNSSVEG